VTEGGPADDVLLATVRDFADRTGALRVTVLLDRGEGHVAPAIEAQPGEAVTISAGDANYVVPPADLIGVAPIHIDTPKPVPPTAIDVDPVTDQIEAPIGVVEALSGAVASLAAAMGGRSVAVVEFATRSGEFSIAARRGEPTVLSSGEHQFEL
jgi:hypothetical protein